MTAILGYEILEKLYESDGSLVYRGKRSPDKKLVILKILKQEYPNLEAIARFKQEYEILRNLNLPGVVKAYSLERYQNSLAIIFEDFGAKSLQVLITERFLTLVEFLTLAIQIVESLAQIHQQQIMHKDINPSNIIFNPTTGQLKIIDFGISTILSRENPTIRNPNVLEGTLPYMSPEQTGRMNRAIDYRTDFYSLGATFYELLTRQLPFNTNDAMELVHCHIARQPIPPQELNPYIPETVSAIVMKLLAKTAEDRYQSAYGIKADLELCLTQLQHNNRIVPFPLGTYDISDKFQIPQKLYGREKQIETLLSAFDRVIQGKSEIMLVSGYSGIGKSALVQEIYKPITRQKGYFISGKFDQLQRNIPYASLIQAFQGLIRQLLTESEAQIVIWRLQLLDALGVNGQVIIDVIPEVELIIGKQPVVVELAPKEAQNRFNLVFQNFIKVFTKPEHPLVIFLDDLQWTDTASLKLMQLLITAPDSQYLFLIGAYRDNEVSAAHPLMLTLNEIQKTDAIVNHVSLLPLDLNHIKQLISDTLNCELEKAKPLAELVLEKTHGNPFFMNEFFKSLYTERLLYFDFTPLKSPTPLPAAPPLDPPQSPLGKGGRYGEILVLGGIGGSKGEWQWNLEQIKAAQITDNVVELMAGKIQKLSSRAQQILKLAACIGNQFDLKTLSVVYEKPQFETASELWEAVHSGLVLPIGNDYKFIQVDDPVMPDNLSVTYKFLHDRVQQAAYSLIPEERKQVVHLQVGKLLLKNTPLSKREEKIFDITNQLNFGIDLIINQSDRDEIAQLNLIAGKKAKAASAYEPASSYLRVGIRILAENSWQQQYDLTLALYVEAAEAAYLSGEFEKMEQLAEVVLQRANSTLDKAKVYEVKIQACMGQYKILEALKIGLQVLELVGVKFPENPSKINILLSLLRTKSALFGKRISSLIDLPEISNPSKLAAIRIMASIASASYLTAPTLFPLTVFEQVNLSLNYGNSSESAFAYATYGLILCGKVGDIDSGYQFGELALSLLERFNAKHLKARTLFVVNVFIRHWKEAARKTLKPLLQGYQSGLETGDLEYAAFCVHFYCSHSYFTGKELGLFEQEIALYADVIGQLKRETILYLNKIYRQAVLNLMNRAEDNCRLIGEYYDEEKMLPLHLKANYKTAICSLYFHKLILAYLFGDFKQAIENAALTEKYIDAVIGTLTVPSFYFFYSLAHLAIYCEASKFEQKRILKKVRDNQKRMKNWAHHAPTNYLHKFYLVEAERHRVLEKNSEATDYYDRAIALAKEHEYINEEALANELAAKFYLAKGKDAIASAYLLNAHSCYLQWGATAKVKDLEAKYPQLLARIYHSSAKCRTKTTTLTTGRGLGSELDLATVMKATQAISGEIMLDKLLAELMKILIENAGAQKGFLILKTNDKLLIEAEGVVDSESVATARHRVTVLQSISIESKDEMTPPLPRAIINYVIHTKENVVLNEATREGKFTNDPYILRYKPKSILCTPLINQGKLIGILYLENNLTGGAFTPERLEVLQLLSSQAAISIQNAKLYSEVHESENRLTQILEAMPVGVVVIDANGKPYYTNHTAEQLLGKGVVRSAQLNQLPNVYQLYIQGTNQPYPKEKMTIVRALKGEKTIIDDMEIHQGDKIIPIESRGTPVFDEKGNIVYAIAAFQDITERKRAEAERITFTNKLFQLNKAYERFVPRQFLQFLGKKSIVDVQLGDHVQQEMSVLFADIRDFTTLSESMTPEENFKFINSYLSRMSPVISENHGFIDKYIGDAIMALFSGSADNAVKAGIAMLHSLAEYNQHRQKQGYARIQIGIGINTGLLMLGTVGEQNRMDGTVISDAVNLASRIEELTKSYGVSLLISHQTFSRLQDTSQYDIRIVDRVKVKGKSELVTVYEVFNADLPEIREGKLVTKMLFEEAQKLYTMGNFRAAAQCFQDCLCQNPRDKVVQIYLERCQLKEKG